MDELEIREQPAARSGHETAPRPAAPRSPVGRGEHARARVLRAALEVLAADGLSGLTMEAVARRAGASKATLYRRYSSRAAMLVDAMGATFEPRTPPPTGHLRTDLVALVRGGEDLLDSQPFARLMAAVVDAAERDPALATMHDDLTERRREPVRILLAEAKRRGEIARTADVELAVDLLAGPLFYRRFFAHRPFPAAYAEALVDAVLVAIGGRGVDAGYDPSLPPRGDRVGPA